MATAKCPLCGKSVDLEGVAPGMEMVCPGCECTFKPKAVRKKKSAKPKSGAKSSQTGRRKRAEPERFAPAEQSKALFWGKIAGVAAFGLIMAIVVIKGVDSMGESFSKQNDEAALEQDLKAVMRSRIAALATSGATKTGKGPIVISKSFEMDWDNADGNVVPFTAELEDFIDSRNRIKFEGELDRDTGDWVAKADRLNLNGSITLSRGVPVPLAIILGIVALGMVGSLTKIVFWGSLFSS